ncbi:MAG: PRC-barrel domain-containing protein [Beijerinckiaceae bacterium]|nr:PRC-barrel domain-containing protein [Beijerinckiaceae bacterium]
MNKALAAPGPNQMMGSDIRGTRVYGANNENVGDIDDMLIDQQGQVVALVVGVGGFLGIGQKDVAIPFQAFEFVTDAQSGGSRTSSTTSTRPSSSSSATGSSTSEMNQSTSSNSSGGSSSGPSSTGSTPGSQSTMTTTTTTTTSSMGVLKPERIVLRGMTKADLQAAPEFKKTGASSNSGSSRSGETRTAPSGSSGSNR